MAGITVALGSVIVITSKVMDGKRTETAGAPDDAWLVEHPDGPALVVSDLARDAREQSGRLVAVDARDGKRLATRFVERKGFVCSPAPGGRLWCLFDRLVLLDARTLADVVAPADARPPELSLATHQRSSCDRSLLEADKVRAVDLGGPCQLAGKTQNTLVVATTDGHARALAIDTETGAVRWRLRFERP
jgi:hypothetical protein